MKTHIFVLACCYSAVMLINAVPLPTNNQELDVLQIPLADGKELDVLTLSAKDQEELIAERNKRTIGLLRELFPDITKNGATDTQIDLSAINKQLEETIRVARQVQQAEAAAQAAVSQTPPPQLPLPVKQEESIQLNFHADATPSQSVLSNEIQQTDSKSPAIDDLSLDSNEEPNDLDDRNKRFLMLGGAPGASAGGAAGGGAAPGGGSGNFLFDIIRLFSGSVQTQAGDDASNGAGVGNSVGGSDTDDTDATRATDGYSEGIPGPVTRLVVLANRGLANLVQDLILRVAATSEKFVNFKAKLITALI